MVDQAAHRCEAYLVALAPSATKTAMQPRDKEDRMHQTELIAILRAHEHWVKTGHGLRAILYEADLSGMDLGHADLREANLGGACLRRANLRCANLQGAAMQRADLTEANAHKASLFNASLYAATMRGTNLSAADLYGADLSEADLTKANLVGARLVRANLTRATLTHAELAEADLQGVRGLVKTMGVEPGNIYWKRIGYGLNNMGFRYQVGLNKLPDDDTFAADERVLCSYPGLYFGTRSWCAVNCADRPYEAKIRIPEGAKINEPWATDGKASADRIEILQVFDARTGKEVTDKFRSI